jgi:hypothetical protein
MVYEQALEFAPCTINDDEEAATRLIVYHTYSHSGWFWHTPKTFALPPRMKLDTAGWKIGCHGIPCYQVTVDEMGQLAPIHPFRHSRTKCCQNIFDNKASFFIGDLSLKSWRLVLGRIRRMKIRLSAGSCF